MVTAEVWEPSYERKRVPLSDLPEVYGAISSDSSVGLTLDDGEDDCVIVTVEAEFSTVTILRGQTFYNLQISDDVEPVEITVAGEEITWPQGCLLPREVGARVLVEAGNREVVWNRYTWVEQ